MRINRRQFLILGVSAAGAAVLLKTRSANAVLPEFPSSPLLGRVFYNSYIDTRSAPYLNSATLQRKFDDSILVIKKIVIGDTLNSWHKSRTWYETDEGYIPSNSVQLVKNLPNQPLTELPIYGTEPGFWGEVTVPYVDHLVDGGIRRSPLLQEIKYPRFYYSQVLWVNGIRTNTNGEIEYHLTEKYGSYGDTFWADARAILPLTPESLAPITPDNKNKYIVVDVTHQTMSCYENDREILFSRVSTGALYNNEGKRVDLWETPIGDYHVVNRKYLSLHMAGGSALIKSSGYEEFAVSYTSIFASGGVAIHSTYWHNNYGETQSHGCVNAPPEVAKFVYRWTQPDALYYEGEITLEGYSGTNVKVQEPVG